MSDAPSNPSPQKPRQPRPDAKLLNLPEERQRQIWEWCKKPADRDPETGEAIPGTGGQTYALAQLAADGCKVSRDTLSRACSFWRLQEDFSVADTEAKQVEEFLRHEFADVTPDKIAKAGQLVFTMRAKNSGDSETFVALENLRLSREIAETKGALEQAKLELRKVAESRSQEALKLEREKFKASIRTKVEAGLAEIAEQVKGNKAAEAALTKLQEAIAS